MADFEQMTKAGERSVQAKPSIEVDESTDATPALSRETCVQRQDAIGQWWSGRSVVQTKGGSPQGADVHKIAAEGLTGTAARLPHLDAIQKSFGRHDVSSVQAHTGGAAQSAADQMNAEAYATGNAVAFRGPPSLHTAAHEAAHVVQQRAGVHLKDGVGAAGDAYERHADAVADAVVQGRSAEALLSRGPSHADGAGEQAVQREEKKEKDASPPMHKVVKKGTATAKVFVKDTNYTDEDLGYILLEMDVVKTATGQVYPYQVNCRPKFNGARAQRYLSMGADVKSHSFNVNGNRFAEIHFIVHLGGPNTTSTSGISLGASIGWKNKAETLEAGGQASWTHSTATTSKATQNFSRVFFVKSDLSFTLRKHDDITKSNPLVIDDDEAGDTAGTIYADWHIHTYGGYSAKSRVDG